MQSAGICKVRDSINEAVSRAGEGQDKRNISKTYLPNKQTGLVCNCLA